MPPTKRLISSTYNSRPLTLLDQSVFPLKYSTALIHNPPIIPNRPSYPLGSVQMVDDWYVNSSQSTPHPEFTALHKKKLGIKERTVLLRQQKRKTTRRRPAVVKFKLMSVLQCTTEKTHVTAAAEQSTQHTHLPHTSPPTFRR